MKIIDAHLHYFAASERFSRSAEVAGHSAEVSSLIDAFEVNHIVGGIGMGTVPDDLPYAPLTLPFTKQNLPKCLVQCLGIPAEHLSLGNEEAAIILFEQLIKSREAVGLKVYAGYRYFYVNDPIYHPFYELAEEYDIPVVIHTGDTANPQARLKYAHPLTVDEAAVNFPRVKFVMAHYGNPWIVDATEVAKKNPNVYIDLSGLAEGLFQPGQFCNEYGGYIDMLRTWLAYLGRYDKIMYGSDWPLVNIPAYIELIKRLIPQIYHNDVFYKNAKQLFNIKQF